MYSQGVCRSTQTEHRGRSAEHYALVSLHVQEYRRDWEDIDLALSLPTSFTGCGDGHSFSTMLSVREGFGARRVGRVGQK